MKVQAKVEIQRRFDWFYFVIAEFSLCNLGNYAVLAILSIYFVHSLNLPAAQAGGLMLFTSLSSRLSRVFLAPLIDRFPVRQSTFMALFLASVGYLGMSVVRTPLLVLLMLLIAGVGHSTNTLLVKTMTAQAKSSGKPRQSPFLRYASLTIGVNLAAAVGSVLGSILLFRWSPAGVFLIAAVTYGLSGFIAMLIPASEVESNPRRPKWGIALRLSLRLPALWRAILFAFMGWFLYTQSYASLPLFISEAVHRPELLGSVFALNAILVVAGQLPVSKTILYLRLPTSQSVLLAFLAFACGFALLWFFPGWQIVYAAVTLWTLGEMLLMPALDTLVAEGALVEHKQVAFAVYSVAVGLGEGLGNLFGVSLVGFLLKSGNVSYLYTLLTGAALGAMVVTVFAASRKESMILRLLNGQPLRPTGHTQLLHPEPAPSEKL
jgi:MFS transporter, DHA1 family, multidrug resistance protein